MYQNSKIHIIAEAGSNNNGDFQKSLNLVKIAKESGADSVKFQMINTWGLYLPGQYEYGKYDISEVLKFRLDGELTDDEYLKINEYAQGLSIDFSASVFDSKGLKLLDSFDPPYIKLASCDLNNLQLINEVVSYNRKLILSTGMSTLKEIENTLNYINKLNFTDIVLLHCVSIYPAQLSQTNLSMISTLKNEFGFNVGFSDHTRTSLASCMALSLGATWFEKHFTESNQQTGLDHLHALEPLELNQYVKDLHDAEISLELLETKVSEAEIFTKKRARRSLYAGLDLKEGHIIQEDDVLVVRPENEMSAELYFDVIGKKLKKSIDKYTPFNLSYFED
jgi:sialic acid synthase SpsE